MGANLQFACPVDGCNYSAGFRLGMGEEDLSEEHEKRLALLLAEHPNHPQASAGARNVKPKELHLENLLDEDGELTF